MHTFLLLVIALGGGDWSCTETDGLWDCRPAQALPAPRRVAPPARPATAQTTPLVAPRSTLQQPPALAPQAAFQEIPQQVPQEAPQQVPQEATEKALQKAPRDVLEEVPEEEPQLAPEPSPEADPQATTATDSITAAPAAPIPQAAEQSAPQQSEAPLDPDSPPPELMSAFIVQIGAYRRREEAQQAADELAYADLAIVPTLRDEKTWYVLLLGAYRTLPAARAAGDAYEARTGGSYWVRTGADLQQSIKKAAPST